MTDAELNDRLLTNVLAFKHLQRERGLLRHFGAFDRDRVTIIDNIHANAEGYEYLAERRLRREGIAG